MVGLGVAHVILSILVTIEYLVFHPPSLYKTLEYVA